MTRCPAVVFAAATSLLLQQAAATAQGAVKLDNYTLDKWRAIPDISTLVKFDQAYAYGEKEDAFKELSKLSNAVPGFFVAEVPVQEYGDKENDDLRLRFKLTKDDFPAYFLFNKDNADGLRYSGDIKTDLLASFLRKNLVRMPAIGTIDELDEIAKKFLKGDLAEEHLKAAKDLAEGEYSADRKAPMYVKIMQKIKDKGVSYVEAETTRVNKLLKAGNMGAEKKAEMTDKLNILGVFSSKDEL